MIVKDSPTLTKAIRNKDYHELAAICIGWTSKRNYTIDDAFREGLAVGVKRPKRLFSAKTGAFTFFFEDETEALKQIGKIPDLIR